jgi:predicted permease
MDLIRSLLSRCIALFRSSKLDNDLDEELRAHIDLAIEENLKCGMSARDARLAALRGFGGVTQTKEQYRMRRGLPFIETLGRDTRYALRQLSRSPGFTATAILTLALGIGANAAIFSVVQGVLLAPLPYPKPDRLVLLQQSRPNVQHLDISYPDFQDWQRTSRSFERMAALSWRDYDLTGPGTPEHLAGMEVSSAFFSTLGVKPALGRDFTLAEDRPQGAPAILISDRLWRDRFASSPQALGKSMIMDGVDFTIIGVLPPKFRFWTDADVYASFGQRSAQIFLNDRTVHSMPAIGRMKTEVSMGQAQSEMSAVQENLDRLYPAADRNLGTTITPLKQAFVGDVSSTLLLLMGAVGIVLLIACTNVANLLLARSASRRREFAIRKALGANRTRIVQQLLTESVLLALTGGLLGLGLAKLGLSLMLTAFPDSLPRTDNIGLHLPALLFALSISLAVGILFGLAPAFKSSRVSLQDSLKTGDRGSTRVQHRSQSALVVVQMALTLVLLVGSGLLLRTIRHLWSVNPGFDASHVITFKVGLSPSLTNTAASTRIAYRQLLDRIRHIPGVEAADLTNIVPLSNQDNSGPFWLGTQVPASPQDAPHALYFWAGPSYLEVMKIPLLRGRFFTAADTSKSEPVIVIDSVLAQTYFPDRDPLGQTVTVAHWGAARVVGVVGHVKHWGLADPATYNPGQIYISVYQLSDTIVPVFSGYLRIVVRTPLDAATVMPDLKNAIYSAGKDQPVYGIETLDEIVSASTASQRLPMMMLGAFAGLALLLASVGIYGTISYSVSQRVQEIGIRMALGAKRGNVLRMVIGQGLRLAVVGLVLGGAVALLLGRLLKSFSLLLYGVRPNDPATFIAVSLVLISAALLACCIPARRAMGVDPMQVLRTE